MTHLKRRTLLGIGAIGFLDLPLFVPLVQANEPTNNSPTSDFDILRKRWGQIYIGTGINPTDPVYSSVLLNLETAVDDAIGKLNTSPNRTSVFTDMPLGTDSSLVTATFLRLQTMAAGVVVPGTRYTGNASLRAEIIRGLDLMVDGEYSSTRTINTRRVPYGNWYDWQMGAPRPLATTAILLYDSLSAAQVARYCASIDYYAPDPTKTNGSTSTGANRAAACQVTILRGVLGGSASKLLQATTAIKAAFSYTTTGDGFYADGTFIQHTNIAYTGLYGMALVGEIMPFVSLLSGTSWPMPSEGISLLSWAAENTFSPCVINGLMTDTVRGRQIAYHDKPDVYYGNGAAVALARLAVSVSDPIVATRLNARAKGWLERSPRSIGEIGFLPGAQIGDFAITQNLLQDKRVVSASEPIQHKQFPTMARVIHRRNGWTFSLALASKRIAWFESVNRENLRGWHTGMGMGLVYLDSDKSQFNDAFWPTVDPYGLSGTTVSTTTLTDVQSSAKAPAVEWVGGTTDGEYGSVGQDVRGPQSTLVGKKSWFCVDDAVICLGAGISSTDPNRIVTTVENRNLGEGGGNTVLIDGETVIPTLGETVTKNASWAWVSGHNGYVFPNRTSLNASRDLQSGSWRDINKKGSGATAAPDTIYNRQFVRLQIDHGVSPTDQTYAYILMPGATRDAVAQRAAITNAPTGWMRILANTAKQQGVEVPSLGFTAVNFFNPGTVGKVSSTAPLSVLIRQYPNGTASISVSDTTRSVTSCTVTWNVAAQSVLATPPSVSKVETGNQLRITFNGLNSTSGSSQQVLVRLGSTPVPEVVASLDAGFNNIAITTDIDTNSGNMDGNGASYSAQALAAAGVVPGSIIDQDGIKFAWPISASGGQPDNMVSAGQTVAINGQGNKIGILVAASYGPISAKATINYTDGSTQDFPINVASWTRAGSKPTIESTYQNRPWNMRFDGPAYVWTVHTNLIKGKTVKSVQFPNISSSPNQKAPSLHVFAIALGD